MKKNHKIDVLHVALLANLIIDPDQATKLQSQFYEILGAITAINKANTDKVPPTSQVTGQVNVTRKDEIDSSRILSQAQAVSQASKAHKGYLVVPHVFK